MKKYGIYTCFPPGVDLRHEGLGRYLAAFIKGAENKNNAKFVLLCPSWSRKDLQKLFESENVPLNLVEIHAPKGYPIILKITVWLIRMNYN